MSEQPERVPQLLVSVRSVDEVAAALDGGADWIDLKEPNAGPLAAVSHPTALEAVAALAERRPLSAALGELLDWPDSPSRQLLEVAGIGLVKLGLAGCSPTTDWQRQWLNIERLAGEQSKRLVLVLYADWKTCAAPSPGETLRLASESSSSYLLIDTYEKQSRSTFDYLQDSELVEILHRAQQLEMTTVLAGGITRAQIELIPAPLVDIVAVRGAVCQGERTATVVATLVAEFRNSLNERLSCASARPA